MFKVITNLKYNGMTYKPDALVDLPEENGVVSLVKEKIEKEVKTDKPKKVESVEKSNKKSFLKRKRKY